jgi:Large polyvalent protein associated domain 23
MPTNNLAPKAKNKLGIASSIPPNMSERFGAAVSPYLQGAQALFPPTNPYGQVVSNFLLGQAPQAAQQMAAGYPNVLFNTSNPLGGKRIVNPVTLDMALALPVATAVKGAGMAGGGVAATFAGARAKTANHAALALAEEMKVLGTPDEEIYKATGWFFGSADGKPRFEIDDSGAMMSSNPLPSEYIESVGRQEPSWKVGQVLDHSDLYSAYPSTKDIQSSFMYGEPGNASYSSGADWISYNAESMKMAVPSRKQQEIIAAHKAESKAFYARPDVKAWNDATENFNFDQPNMDAAFNAMMQKHNGAALGAEESRLHQKSADLRNLAGEGYALRNGKSITLHELQHAIQQREGFARGGSPEQFTKYDQALLEQENAKYSLAMKELIRTYKESGKSALDAMNSPQGKVLGESLNKLQDAIKNPFGQYRRLAGEAEARLTQSRMDMTGAERAASYPPGMFDVPVGDQIVRYGEGPALATTWHGSPHLFPPTPTNNLGEFNAANIGTGEGAQAYGHGLYLAESPDVAKTYAKGWRGQSAGDMAERYMKNFGNKEAALQAAEARLAKVTEEFKPEFVQPYRDAVEMLRTGNIEKGGLYKVDIPDEQIAKMLDWDKPLSEQTAEVRQALKGANIDSFLKVWPGEVDGPTGEAIYNYLRANRGTVTAADTLRNQAIPGIRYLDAGSRGAEGGTSNFVVFPGNEHMMTILERNGQAMSPESQAIARYREIKGPKSVVRMEAALRTAGVPLPKNEPVAYIQRLVDQAHRRN